MSKRLKDYRNKDKMLMRKHKDYTNYYNKSEQNLSNNKNIWTKEETYDVLFAPMTDTELSQKLGRSIRAIQIRRSRCKKQAHLYL